MLSALLTLGCSRSSVSAEQVGGPSPQDPSFYAPLTELLALSQRPEGVCYALIKAQLADPISPLSRQLQRLKPPLPTNLSPHEELAYWVNAYNTLMLARVAELWPVKSVKGALPGAPYAIFKEKRFEVAGQRRSLDELEHQLIRPRFKDPRVHAALNCASASCPPLASTPFLPTTLDAQLDQVARSFVNDPVRQRLQRAPRAISMIFKWYAQDFQASGGVKVWMSTYLKEPLRATLLRDSTPVGYLTYDWSLNQAPAERCAPIE